MRWLRRAPASRPAARPDVHSPPGLDAAPDDVSIALFACSACGRTDLPPAGDWDPPVCSECDAQLNFDAILESEFFEGR